MKDLNSCHVNPLVPSLPLSVQSYINSIENPTNKTKTKKNKNKTKNKQTNKQTKTKQQN